MPIKIVNQVTRVLIEVIILQLDPFKVIKTGPGYDITGDPLKPLEAELANYKYVSIPEVPTFTGEYGFEALCYDTDTDVIIHLTLKAVPSASSPMTVFTTLNPKPSESLKNPFKSLKPFSCFATPFSSMITSIRA